MDCAIKIMENLIKLVEALSSYAWPVAVILIFCTYRDAITKFLGALGNLKAEHAGSKLSLGQTASQERNQEKGGASNIIPTELISDDDNKKFPALQNPADLISDDDNKKFPILQNKVKDVEERINNHKISEDLDDPQLIAQLTTEISGLYLALEYEQHYQLIFGSQIILLTKLEENTMSEGEVREYFTDTRMGNLVAFDKWDMPQYISFLFGTNLIEAAEAKYKLTDNGKSFLSWLAAQNKPAKPY